MDHSIFTPKSCLGPVFCDWLNVTCSPENSFEDPISRFLDSHGFTLTFATPTKRVYHTPAHFDYSGTVKLDVNSKFHCLFISGSSLKFFRDCGFLISVLDLISEVPHTITRIDVACDYKIDAPVALRALELSYPLDKINLSRKTLKITRLYSARDDGQLTGTWYAGHGQKSNISARIYDKTNELFEKKGLITSTQITRVELTASKRLGATLKDVYSPEPLYYYLGAPHFFAKPASVPDWVSAGEFCSWVSTTKFESTPIELIKKKIEFSPDLIRIAELCSPLGEEGVRMTLRHIENHLRSLLD